MGNKKLYLRQSAYSSTLGTRIPDMERIINDDTSSPASSDKKKNVLVSSEPIIGFLYSVSRSMAGEYWPLHLGENTIGRDSDNDIVLSEQTVSGHHAILNIRRMKTTKEYLADITVRGVNGGFVNEDEVRKQADCKNGDFITIGDNYVLYLILINPFELGMKVAEAFIPAEESDEDSSELVYQDHDITSGSDMYNSRRRPVGGTEGMDGVADIESGFTSQF